MVEQLLGPALAPGQQAQVAEQLPAQLAGLLPGDVCGVVADAVAGAAAEALAEEERRGGAGSSSSSSGDAAGPGSGPPAAIQVDGQHVEQALARVKARTATEIGAPQVPNVKWDDIGGLEDVKRAILDTIELPLRHRWGRGWQHAWHWPTLTARQHNSTSMLHALAMPWHDLITWPHGLGPLTRQP
jgi:hypothetical protein